MTVEAPIRKVIYFAKRNQPSLERWRARWRAHGALAMSLPLWAALSKYSQCDTLPAGDFANPEDYDGVGLCWFRPAATAGVAGLDDPEGVQKLLRDEDEAFGGFVGNFSVIGEETILREGHGAPIKIFLILYRASGAFDTDQAAFGQALLADPELSARIRRLSLNPVVEDDYSVNSSLDFDGVIELSADSQDEARAILNSPRLKAIAERFAGGLRLGANPVVTHENMFYDELIGCDEGPALIRDYLKVAS